AQGVGRGSMVALMVNRSIERIVGIFGVIKAGGTYVPIEPSYPEARIEYILQDSGARVLLTQPGVSVPDAYTGQVLWLDDPQIYQGEATNVPRVTQPEDLIYLIYTSGSTGTPKGVMVEHQNLVRLWFYEGSRFRFSEGEVWGMFHSYCFDVSVWE